MNIEEIKNTVIQGDCLEVLRGLPDKCVDLVLTSPPYDNLREYKGYTFNFEGIAKELYRVVKDGGVVVWVVNDATINGSETGTSFKQALYFKEIGFNLHDTMIWTKLGGGAVGSNLCYTQNFEYMFVFSKGRPKSINLIRDLENGNFGKGSGIHQGRRKKDGTIKIEVRKAPSEYSKRNNHWYIPPQKGEHPAVFPEKLAEDHILSWSNENDIILDPMCGSGTTCVAAKMLKRDFIGIEISEKYCAIARERLSHVTKTLF
jgi:site-specific DNA-methyltransferase (adenine-specific)